MSASPPPSPPATIATILRRQFRGITPQPDLPHNDFIRELNFTLWILIGSSGAFLALRLYCKVYRQRGLWWDDGVLTAAWITLVTSGIFATVSTTYGFGKHIYDIQSRDLAPLLLVLNISGFFSLVSAAWSKTSFAITLLRISDGGIKKFIWFIIVSVNVLLALAALFTWIQCSPIERTWNPFIEGTCWDSKVFVIYNSTAAAYSGLADIVLATLPWRIIGRLTMHKKERIGMMFAMSMGVFAGITSITKTITIPAFADTDLINTVPLIILGVAESAVTIIAASIPVLRALLRENSSLPTVRTPMGTPSFLLSKSSNNFRDPGTPPMPPLPTPGSPKSPKTPITPMTPARQVLLKRQPSWPLGGGSLDTRPPTQSTTAPLAPVQEETVYDSRFSLWDYLWNSMSRDSMRRSSKGSRSSRRQSPSWV